MNARLAAVSAIAEVVIHKKSLAQALPNYLDRLDDHRDKGLCQQIIYGSLRYYPSLLISLNQQLKKPITNKNKLLEILLITAFYQLYFLQNADYATINESVKLSKKLHLEWAKNLINAVLRNISKNKPPLKKDRYLDQPKWLFEQLKSAYPQHYREISESHHFAANVMLRTHTTERKAYLALLAQQQLEANPHPDSKDAIILGKNIRISALPLFDEGKVTVQDANAQLAANLLGLKDNMRVLDACAAPGGKTAHIASKAQNLDIIAIDESAVRLQRLTQTLTRLNVNATTHAAKLESLSDWYDGQPFDRILLDAPCSATGVIRKHPDILHLRQASDIDTLAEIQANLLDVCWSLLKENGILVYATCSILPIENSRQVKQFLVRTQNAKLKPLAHNRATPESVADGMLQFLPDELGDGFFYATIIKT